VADAELAIVDRDGGRWEVRSGENLYVILADPAHGLACSCSGWRYRNQCRHVTELLRRQAEGRVTEPERIFAFPVEEFPDALLAADAPPEAAAASPVDVPPSDLEADDAIGGVPSAVVPLSNDAPPPGPQATLLAAIERDTEAILDRFDRRLERVKARLAGGADDPAAPAPSVMAKYRAARERVAREKHNAA
jgi:hypothetical protein